MKEQVICPWCLTEIVWDEEIGPEQHCPHCENELSAYRSLELGGSGEEEQEEYVERSQTASARSSAWSEEDGEDDSGMDHDSWLKQGQGYRSADKSWLAIEHSLQGITDDQDEVPECPACREYMLEAGMQLVGEQHFEPRIAPSINGPVLTAPFKLITYICPACFHTSALLSKEDRERMIKRLTPNE
ncbi:hypothetical protein [Paenibacillus harenae]|uniref:hypothetical protein n=1 Tax=Paenibacillus harenae TaxID=306543 RepID=UPI0003F8CC58|nr:hypothetical protein [Paenibacillus harenae]